MKLIYQYMAIFFTFSPTSNHFQSLQVENCDSNSRLVVDENDNGKFVLKIVKLLYLNMFWCALRDPHEIVGRDSETQLQVGENLNSIM